MAHIKYWLAYTTDSFGVFNEYPKNGLELQYKRKDFSYEHGTIDELFDIILDHFSYTDLFKLCIDDIRMLQYGKLYSLINPDLNN